MSHEQLVEMARRGVAHWRAGTQDQVDGVFRVPSTNYYDPGRWQLEMDRIFRRLPMTLGFTTELRAPGSYRALEMAGVPVLLTREQDGQVRAYRNDLYDLDESGTLDGPVTGLTALPAAERAGLIWAILDPASTLDIDVFLGDYTELLGHLHFEDCYLVGRQRLDGPNWKIAYDGYLDFYHLPILHRNSFGPNMSSKAIYHSFGPHQRVCAPDRSYAVLADQPEEEWAEADLVSGVWTIFPHISIAGFDANGRVFMFSQLFPGATPADSYTVQTFLHSCPPDDDQAGAVAARMAFLADVVGNEDYYTGRRIQRAVATGTKPFFHFGRNEGGGQRFHSWVQAVVDADDAELPALFASEVPIVSAEVPAAS